VDWTPTLVNHCLEKSRGTLLHDRASKDIRICFCTAYPWQFNLLVVKSISFARADFGLFFIPGWSCHFYSPTFSLFRFTPRQPPANHSNLQLWTLSLPHISLLHTSPSERPLTPIYTAGPHFDQTTSLIIFLWCQIHKTKNCHRLSRFLPSSCTNLLICWYR